MASEDPKVEHADKEKSLNIQVVDPKHMDKAVEGGAEAVE